MTDPESLDLAVMFQRLQTLLLSGRGLEAFLQQLAELAAGAADQPVSCGITMQRDGQPLTVVSSDLQARFLDEGQYATDQGPCLQALSTGEIVSVVDFAGETRWPDYLPRVRKTALRCSLSIPLSGGGTTMGAMNLYGFAAVGVFTAAVQHRCELFAAQAAGALQMALGRTAHEH